MASLTRDRALQCVAVTCVLATTSILPWAASGAVSRSGWSVVGSARRLGVVNSGFDEMFAIGFFLIPAFACGAVVAFAIGRPSVVAALTSLAIVASVGVGVAIIGSPLRPRWGLWLNIVVACVDGLLVVRLLRDTSLRRESQQT